MYYSKNQMFFELQYIMPEVFKIFLKKTPEKYSPKIPKKYNTIPNNIIFKKYNPDQKKLYYNYKFNLLFTINML